MNVEELRERHWVAEGRTRASALFKSRAKRSAGEGIRAVKEETMERLFHLMCLFSQIVMQHERGRNKAWARLTIRRASNILRAREIPPAVLKPAQEYVRAVCLAHLDILRSFIGREVDVREYDMELGHAGIASAISAARFIWGEQYSVVGTENLRQEDGKALNLIRGRAVPVLIP